MTYIDQLTADHEKYNKQNFIEALKNFLKNPNDDLNVFMGASFKKSAVKLTGDNAGFNYNFRYFSNIDQSTKDFICQFYFLSEHTIYNQIIGNGKKEFTAGKGKSLLKIQLQEIAPNLVKNSTLKNKLRVMLAINSNCKKLVNQTTNTKVNENTLVAYHRLAQNLQALNVYITDSDKTLKKYAEDKTLRTYLILCGELNDLENSLKQLTIENSNILLLIKSSIDDIIFSIYNHDSKISVDTKIKITEFLNNITKLINIKGYDKGKLDFLVDNISEIVFKINAATYEMGKLNGYPEKVKAEAYAKTKELANDFAKIKSEYSDPILKKIYYNFLIALRDLLKEACSLINKNLDEISDNNTLKKLYTFFATKIQNNEIPKNKIKSEITETTTNAKEIIKSIFGPNNSNS